MSDEDNDAPDGPPEIRRVKLPVSPESRARSTRRRPIHGVLVAIDAPDLSDEPWVVDAVDINAGGMGLVLPDVLDPGAVVELSFRLEEGVEFSRVPGVVLHREGISGGVGFREWGDSDRLRLLEYLVRVYEQADS
jgi:hypothetical protein